MLVGRFVIRTIFEMVQCSSFSYLITITTPFPDLGHILKVYQQLKMLKYLDLIVFFKGKRKLTLSGLAYYCLRILYYKTRAL